MSEQALAVLKEQAKQRVCDEQARLEELNRWMYHNPRTGLRGTPILPTDCPRPGGVRVLGGVPPPMAWKRPSRPGPGPRVPN